MNTRQLPSESGGVDADTALSAATEAVDDARRVLAELLADSASDPVAFALDRERAAAVDDAAARLRDALLDYGATAYEAAAARRRPSASRSRSESHSRSHSDTRALDSVAQTGDDAGASSTDERRPSATDSASTAEPPRPAITQDLLDRLRANMQPAWDDGRDHVEDVRLVRGVLDRLGPTPETLGWRAAGGAIEALEEVVAEIDAWGELSQPLNYGLTALATKRARAAQDAIQNRAAPVELSKKVVSVIRRLSAHSQATRPGFVSGLALDHRPERESWLADARHYENDLLLRIGEVSAAREADTRAAIDDELRRLVESVANGLDGDALAVRVQQALTAGVEPTNPRLVNLLVPHVDVFTGRPALATTRRAVQAAIDALDAEADASESSPIDEDWPGLAHTAGRRAVIVGGEPRPQRIDALQRAFRFESVEWIANSEGLRRVQSLVSRMKSGSVDIVICLRAFSSHKVYDAIFDATDVQADRVLADTYGVTQVKLAIERLDGRGARD
ncbi:MAG: hypothetical protein H6697_10930 [Myxococcales bacterium]|nr:hypothetical protein [Myxococcales bacterium]